MPVDALSCAHWVSVTCLCCVHACVVRRPLQTEQIVAWVAQAVVTAIFYVSTPFVFYEYDDFDNNMALGVRACVCALLLLCRYDSTGVYARASGLMYARVCVRSWRIAIAGLLFARCLVLPPRCLGRSRFFDRVNRIASVRPRLLGSGVRCYLCRCCCCCRRRRYYYFAFSSRWGGTRYSSSYSFRCGSQWRRSTHAVKVRVCVGVLFFWRKPCLCCCGCCCCCCCAAAGVVVVVVVAFVPRCGRPRVCGAVGHRRITHARIPKPLSTLCCPRRDSLLTCPPACPPDTLIANRHALTYTPYTHTHTYARARTHPGGTPCGCFEKTQASYVAALAAAGKQARQQTHQQQQQQQQQQHPHPQSRPRTQHPRVPSAQLPSCTAGKHM